MPEKICQRKWGLISIPWEFELTELIWQGSIVEDLADHWLMHYPFFLAPNEYLSLGKIFQPSSL